LTAGSDNDQRIDNNCTYQLSARSLRVATTVCRPNHWHRNDFRNNFILSAIPDLCSRGEWHGRCLTRVNNPAPMTCGSDHGHKRLWICGACELVYGLFIHKGTALFTFRGMSLNNLDGSTTIRVESSSTFQLPSGPLSQHYLFFPRSWVATEKATVSAEE